MSLSRPVMRVLGRDSSINVRKVLWVCAELGLSVEREDWGAGFRDVNEAVFRDLNPNTQIPVLIDGDFVLWESHSILRYLANQYDGRALYPSEPKLRARTDQWMDWQASDLNPSWSFAFSALVRQSPAHAIPEAIDLSIRNWTRFMTVLDHQLQDTAAFVAGDAFSLADIPVGLSVVRWFATPIERPELPHVSAYYERLSERPAFLEFGRNGMP